MLGNYAFHALADCNVITDPDATARTSAITGVGNCVELYNTSSTDRMFVAFGRTAAEASVASRYQIVLLPGQQKICYVGAKNRFVGYKMNAGTATLYLTPGEGL